MVGQARGMDRGQTEISRLQEQRRALANEKRALTRQLKNESRKRARLLQKSSKLSVPDLVQSLYIRQSRTAEPAVERRIRRSWVHGSLGPRSLAHDSTVYERHVRAGA